MGWFFVGIGLFAIAGATFDFEWFMNHRKARIFVSMLGRGGARILYGALGTGLVVLGGLMIAGVLSPSK